MAYGETPEQRRARIDRDLHELRVVAWLVARGRYAREPKRTEGGRRGKTRITTVTFYAETADLLEADEAVREIVRRREAG